jgi:putative DNA primase/helicase
MSTADGAGLLEIALQAVDLGLSVVPPRQDGSKAPCADVQVTNGDGQTTYTWAPYQTTPATREHVLDWYRSGSRTGIGLACGVNSLECFEFDDEATYREFVRAAAELGLDELVTRIESGYCERTPSGGTHWLFYCDAVRGNTKLACRPKPGGKPGDVDTLIETRGQGGFIIIAPSNGRVHPTGGAYVLLSGGLDTISTIASHERDLLDELARSFDEMPEQPAQNNGQSSKPKDSGTEGKRPGDDFNERATWEEILAPHGWTKVFTRGEVTYWRRPRKKESWSATTGHCKGLKVFSTSTPFSTQGTYTKFAAYSTLSHQGDFDKAVKALAQAEYGTWIDEHGTEHQNPVPKGAKRQKRSAATGATSLGTQSAGQSSPSANASGTPNESELGNARRLIRRFGHNLRYSKPHGSWFEWDGTRWLQDQTGSIWRYAKDTVRLLGSEASAAISEQARKDLLRWALKSEEKKGISAMIDLAWSEPGIAIMPEQFDADPYLLNTPSGTVDLRCGDLRPHEQADLITKITSVPFDPTAQCPKWLATLRKIFNENDELIAYVQRALGYSLTGDCGEHCLFLCYGSGRNGKNTLLDTVHAILGDYATVTDPRLFLASNQRDHPAGLADLMGRRFVPTSEIEEGEKLAESLVKRVTGDKFIKARFMRQNWFEFKVLFKVWLLCNHKPEIRGRDEGLWSRVRIIPFDVFIPPAERIKNYSDILVAEEGPGILNWLVEGCLQWQQTGLCEPDVITDAVKTYRDEQDVAALFVSECCESFLDRKYITPEPKAPASKVYSRYVRWRQDNGEKDIMTNKKFGRELTRLGYEMKERNSTCYRMWLRLK